MTVGNALGLLDLNFHETFSRHTTWTTNNDFSPLRTDLIQELSTVQSSIGCIGLRKIINKSALKQMNSALTRYSGNLAHILAIVTIFFAVKLGKAELPEWMDFILVAFVAFHVVMHLIYSVSFSFAMPNFLSVFFVDFLRCLYICATFCEFYIVSRTKSTEVGRWINYLFWLDIFMDSDLRLFKWP